MVGLGGLEPPTSPLSGARSSHLSYRPAKCSGRQLFYFTVLAHSWQLDQRRVFLDVCIYPGPNELAEDQFHGKTVVTISLCEAYCTKPMLAPGMLPSGPSLMVPNCASYRVIFSPSARQIRFAWLGFTIM